MRSENTMRLGVMVVGLCAGLFLCSAAFAQDAQAPQSPSVADAARAARAGKKNAAKPAKIIGDDDIAKKSVKPGAQGLNVGAAPESSAVPPSAAAVSADVASDQAAASAETHAIRKGEDPELAKAKEDLAEAAKQLDLLQRGSALDQDTYFSKPNYTDDKDGKAKLDAEQQQINDKQQVVDRLKARVAELEEARNRKKASAAQGGASQDAERPAEAPGTPPPQS